MLRLYYGIVLLAVGFGEGLIRKHQSAPKLVFLEGIEAPKDIPCSSEKLQFPSNFDAVLQLPQSVSTKGLILPTNGALLLGEGSSLQIFPDDDKRCNQKPAKVSQLTKPKRINWFDPRSWNNESQQLIPDIEQIPCNGDTISLSVKSAMSVDLENVKSLKIEAISVDGREVSPYDLESFFETELGEFMFKSTDGTKARSGSTSICGCHDVANVAEYEYRVCSHYTESCPIPKCFQPIVPTGFCCAICGAVFKLNVDDCRRFDEAAFQRHVDELTRDLESKGKILKYGSLVQEGDDKFYQLVIIDADDYNEESVRFAEALRKSNFQGKHEIYYSGRSYSPNSGYSSWAIIFFTLLVVLAFFFALYAHYERNIFSSVPVPSWLALNRSRVFQSPFVFARFENHPATDVDVPGNIVVGRGQERVHDDEGPSTLATGTTTSFHNPMFDEKEIKSTETMGSSTPDVGKDSASKDDKEFALNIPEQYHQQQQHHRHICMDEPPKDQNDDDVEEEELVEVDLGSDISNGE